MPLKKGLKAKATTMTKTSSPNTPFSAPQIPEHLLEYITEQDPSLYTPEDHAAWRFIMRVSQKFFAQHAHPLYLKGLKATGISTERIPLISEMNTELNKMGWGAVAVNGFIPPSVFLELQSLKFLPIACDMRKIENLGYTPSPDIVHEAAGHAPIIFDPKFRAYLEAYGQVARKAIISKQDIELYNAIYNLSEVKENPRATETEIAEAQVRFEQVAASVKDPSEAALLARMYWWTSEYGMIDVDGKPMIYGAGLLSSVMESHGCIKPEVEKVPFVLDAVIRTSYDITRPQPQLFVAEDFDSLTKALEEFADHMSFRRGGLYGLRVAKKAEATATAVLDSGMQISGIVSDYEKTEEGEILSVTFSGQKQFAYQEEAMGEMPHSLFGDRIYFPMFDAILATVPLQDLVIKLHGKGLPTKNGSRITGQFKKEIKIGSGGRVLVLEKVKVTHSDGEVVFEERLRPYPLIFGTRVTSVFGGASDRKEFALRHSVHGKKVKLHKTNATESNQAINEMYASIRTYRELNSNDPIALEQLYKDAQYRFADEWLIQLELLELYQAQQPESPRIGTLQSLLANIAVHNTKVSEHIRMGLDLLS
jgi:phenylalanine-4-hydroxylase